MLVCKGTIYQIFLALVFLIFHPLLSWSYLVPEVYIKTKNLKCDFEPSWVANVSCKLKPISWERTTANVSVDLLQPLRNLSVHVQAFRLETQYIPFLINVRKNACDIFQRKQIDFYSRIFLDFVNQFLNIKNVTCPLVGHMEFRDAYIKGSNSVFPPGTYKLTLTGFEGYPPKRLGVLTVFFNIVEKRRGFQ